MNRRPAPGPAGKCAAARRERCLQRAVHVTLTALCEVIPEAISEAIPEAIPEGARP